MKYSIIDYFLNRFQLAAAFEWVDIIDLFKSSIGYRFECAIYALKLRGTVVKNNLFAISSLRESL